MKLLRNSAEISAALNELFAHDVPKLALVAFVGKNACDHLPQEVSDLSIICWPKAGGTHPDGVSRLVDAGCDVQFCDRLHSKIYWAEGKGMIVGSANLSDNALGSGNLDEYAVLTEEGLPTRQDLLATLQRQPTPVTAEALQKLRIEHRKYWQRNAELEDRAAGSGTEARDFEAYLAQEMPAAWKIVTYAGEFTPEEKEVRINQPLRQATGTADHHNYNQILDWAPVDEGDFLLQIQTDKDGNFTNRTAIKWLYVDKLLGDVAVQLHKQNPPEPFKLSKEFRRAVCSVGNELDWSDIRDNEHHHVTTDFMKLVLQAMRPATKP